jgi:UDP-N-acetylglucosamine 1-carboxyvinyltransferase
VGTQVSATDIRGGISVVLTGLVAEGVTIVDNLYQIERGYECFIDKFTRLGARIEYN